MLKKVTFIAYGKKLNRYTYMSATLAVEVITLICPTVNSITIEDIDFAELFQPVKYVKNRYGTFRVVSPSLRRRLLIKSQSQFFKCVPKCFIEEDLQKYCDEKSINRLQSTSKQYNLWQER